MRRNGITFALLAAFVLLVTPLFANNLVYNGNFTPYNGDTPTEPGSSNFCGTYAYCIGYYNQTAGQDFIGSATSDLNGTAWMLLQNPPSGYADVMVLGTNYTEPNNGASGGTLNFHPLAGTLQSLDLTGEGNEGANGVKQTVATTAGQWYTLNFFLGHQWDQAPGYTGGAAELTLWIDGQEIGLYSNDTNNVVDDITWLPESYRFQATSDQTTIAFINANLSQDQRYVGLDGVSLSVPEPGTLVLLVIGAAGLLLVLPRRQKIALFPLRSAKRG